MGQLTRNEVFTLAVQKYSDAVYRAAMHNSRCAADAEDVVQDVYEKLLHYNGTFESEEHLKAWLLRVAINRCRDLTRAAGELAKRRRFLTKRPFVTLLFFAVSWYTIAYECAQTACVRSFS